MTRHTPGRRAGFTLIELLAVMAVIVILATITLAVVPSAIEQDRTTDAAATVRQHLMIAKARATRENNGRGIRFIVAPDTNNPAKTNGPTDQVNNPQGVLWSTEMQYIEAAPTVIPNPLGLTGATDPFVEFDFSTPASPVCRMFNVPASAEVVQIIQNDLGAHWFPKLYCPVLGPDAFGRTQRFEIAGLTAQASPANSWVLTLLSYPVTLMGTGSTQRVYRFAIEPRSRPLLGEPNITLPKNVCVDLAASFPGPTVATIPNPSGPGNITTAIDYEVMFAPTGQVISPESSGQIFLWVRDYTKYGGNPAANVSGVYDLAAYQQGGEQQLIAIKAKTGALGVFPVLWPNSGASYAPATLDPYSLARQEANSP